MKLGWQLCKTGARTWARHQQSGDSLPAELPGAKLSSLRGSGAGDDHRDGAELMMTLMMMILPASTKYWW